MRGAMKHQPAWAQFLVLFLLGILGIFVFTLLGVGLAAVLFSLSGNDLLEMASTSEFPPQVMKLVQGFSTIGTFLVPGLFGAYLFSNYPSEFLKINRFPPPVFTVVLLAVVLTLSSAVVSDALVRFSQMFQFPESWGAFKELLEEMEATMREQIDAFLVMENFGDFLEVFMIMAILPAVCEETLFRGALQPVLIKGFKNYHVGIWITGFLFALLHQQFYTFLSIMALGVVLGYLKEWGKSLWLPILVHLINNGGIVVAIYFFDMNYDEVNEMTSWRWEVAVTGFLIFVAAFFGIKRVLGSSQPTV